MKFQHTSSGCGLLSCLRRNVHSLRDTEDGAGCAPCLSQSGCSRKWTRDKTRVVMPFWQAQPPGSESEDGEGLNRMTRSRAGCCFPATGRVPGHSAMGEASRQEQALKGRKGEEFISQLHLIFYLLWPKWFPWGVNSPSLWGRHLVPSGHCQGGPRPHMHCKRPGW